jgi:hypothetical protein
MRFPVPRVSSVETFEGPDDTVYTISGDGAKLVIGQGYAWATWEDFSRFGADERVAPVALFPRNISYFLRPPGAPPLAIRS